MTSLDLNQLFLEERKYKKQVNKDPTDDSAWFNLGKVYQRQTRFELANDAYQQALNLHEKASYYHRMGEMQYDRRHYGKAMRSLLSALELGGKSWKHATEVKQMVDHIYELDPCPCD